MAQLISVKLSRFDASPWGFRLQGGKDFGAPLLIQKVNGGSPAEKAGLQAGDAVIKVNEVELFNLRHKEAQDSIVRAGNNFELTVQRGGSTWKPQVTPVGPAPVSFNAGGNIQPVTKTSLAAKKQEVPQIGSAHNFAPKPFGGAQVNGIGDPTVKSIVNKQYNTPVGIYSEETIAETLSAQAEVLAGGVLGVNFKKNERTYTPGSSEVLKMVQEIDSEPKTPEPGPPEGIRKRLVIPKPRPRKPASPPDTSPRTPVPPSVGLLEPSVGGQITSPPATGLRHVSAPETKPAPTTPHEDPFKVLPPGQNICADCERLIVGVFVRIKDKNLHVECFKCATCGTSLKNVGYYNINNKLYCDIHAKLVARQNPPAPNLEPITIPPGGRAPAGAISAALGKAPASTFGPAQARAPAPAPAPAPAFAPAAAPARAPAPAPTYAPAPAPVSPGNLSPLPGTLGPLPFHPVHQHRMPENNFVTENNMKNIITALPALEIDDSDSGKYSPEPLVSRPSKAPRGGTTHVNAPRPVKAPSSLAGPKPFGTSSAPTTSPARPAPAGSKFVWPPSRAEEEIISAPTASPLYIPPSPTSAPGTPTGPAPKIPPVAAVKSVPAPAPAFAPAPAPAYAPAPAPPYAPTYAPAYNPAPAPAAAPLPTLQPSASSQAVPFPQPFSVFLAKQQPPMRTISSPVPMEKQPPQPMPLPEFQQPLLPAEPVPIPVEESEDLKNAQEAAFRKKYSMCSQEVLAINKDKPGPRFETLSEALETQMLVTSLTPEPVQRPESPVPMQDSKTSSMQDLPMLAEQASTVPEEQVKTVGTETAPPDSTSASTTEVIPPLSKSLPPPFEVPTALEAQPVVLPEVLSQNPQPSEISSVKAQSEKVSVVSQSETVSISEQSFSSQKTEFSEVKSSSQVTLEKDDEHSQLLAALTTASDRPYSPLPSTGILSQSEVTSNIQSEQTFVNEIQTSSQVLSQSVSGFVPVSREQEDSATQFQQQTRQISSQQSTSLISAFSTAESVQTLSSFAQDRSAACPSPMLAALTVASDRPYSLLPSATIPMAPVPIQSGAISMLAAHPTPFKPVAPAPLPTSIPAPQPPLGREAACPSPMLSALTIAPERPYSPLPSATKVMAPAPMQSAPIFTQPPFPTVIKPVVPAPIPVSMQAPPAMQAPVAPPSMQAPLAPLSREAACPSPMLSALTIAPDRPYSPLPSATRTMASAPTQSAPINTPAIFPPPVKPASSLPPGVQAPLARGGAYPSVIKPAPLPIPAPLPTPAFKPVAQAAKPLPQFKPQGTVAQAPAFKPMAPASKAPAAFKPMAFASKASPFVKPMAPTPQVTTSSKPAGPAPLPLPNNPPALKPVIPAAIASANLQVQTPIDRQAACPSPMLSALTIAPDQPYSPLPPATRATGFAPAQTTARRTSAPIQAPVKFSPSGMKAPVTEKPLRDETQLSQFAKPIQQAPKVSALPIVPPLPTTKFPAQPAPVQEPAPLVKPASATTLPVYGGFRPIVAPSNVAPNASTEFKPIQSEEPASVPFPQQQSAPPPARPKTPVQRVETPTPGRRSATPRSASRLGLQKPAAIPYYQQGMGEYPGQMPRSGTPTCPMMEPRPLTPKVQLTKPEVPYVPQKPSASFQRQPPPTKPYASFQPQPVAQKPQQPPYAASQIPAQQQQQQQQQPPHAAPQLTPVPFPNIPLPEGFDPESMMFKPVAQPVKPSPAPQQTFPPLQTTAPIKPSPLAAPQPASSAPIFKPSPLAAPAPAAPAPVPAPPKTIPVVATQPISVAKTPSVPSSSSIPNAGGGGGGAPGGAQKGASVAGSTAPRRGRGVLTQQSAGGRIPVCAHCSSQIRGPFITALGKNWCPEHFVCVNDQCRRPLADIGFVEEKGELYCEYCFEKYLAPTCNKCNNKIKGDCLNAIGKHFHPECFLCAYCGKLFGNNPFFLEDGLPYCEADWNELFTTKCFACGFPIEAGDRWVEALNNNYHSQCFNCTNCKKNLEGQSFYAKGGRPFCKAHAR